MSRRMMVSALFLAGLFAVGAMGQEPKSPGPAPKPKEKKTDPTDAAVAAALVNDPDVLVARAKVQLAEAELAKARQAVVLKVMTLNAAVQEQKSAVAAAEDRLAWSARMVEKGLMDKRQMVEDRTKLESAKAALTRSQMELKLLTGGDREQGVEFTPSTAHERAMASGLRYLMSARPGEESQHATALAFLAGLDAYRTAHAIKGPIPDTIRAALDKRVKFGRKDFKVFVTFEEALAIFKKEAGLDVPVRILVKDVSSILPEGEELPVGAWFQLFADGNPDARFLVREYGLLVAPKTTAPPDAVSVMDFWKQKLAAATEPRK
jgi:hypothetical protein